jgi:hypothetical protein
MNWSDGMKAKAARAVARQREAREQRTREREAEDRILPAGFWNEVYQNNNHTSASLQGWLEAHSPNLLQILGDTDQRNERRKMRERLDFVRAGPGNTYWFTFWTDLWAHNRQMAVFRAANLEEILDGFMRVMPRAELERVLKTHNLVGNAKTPPFLFSPPLLDRMYREMARAGQAMDLTAAIKQGMLQDTQLELEEPKEKEQANLEAGLRMKKQKVKKFVV